MASGLKPSQKLFEVKWNCQYSTIISLLQKEFEAQKFTDVTISCQGRSIQCHQLVLRASSTYFEKALEEHRCNHPIILLNGITFSGLEKVLEFMYKGIIQIKEDEMSGFFQAAANLKVKWLFAENEEAVLVPTPLVNEPSVSAQVGKQAGPVPPKKKWPRVYKNYPPKNMVTAIQSVLVGVSGVAAADANGVPSRTLYEKLKKLGVPMAVHWKKREYAAKPSTGNKTDPKGVEAVASGTKAESQSGNDEDDDDVTFIAEIQRSNIGRNSAP